MHTYTTHVYAWVQPKVFFTIFGLPWIKTHPKHVPTLPRTSGFYLKPPHSKTQEFTSLKMD